MKKSESIDSSRPPPPMSLAWSIWGLGAMFYLTGFFHRVAPAVMTEELMRDFDIGATALGNLSAFYFYSYAAMQIPTGILADSTGPRRLLSTGSWVAALGTVLFALAPTAFWACAGRMLIGGSVAVAFVGMLKLSSLWFPQRYYSTVSGLIVFCGIIGAVAAGPPLRLLLNAFSWRSVMLAAAATSLLLGAAIRVFVRDFPREKGFGDANPLPSDSRPPQPRASILSGIREVLRYRNTALLLVIPGSLAGTNLTFAGLWGVPFLTTQYGILRSQAAVLATGLLVGFAVGGPAIGWLTQRWGRRKPAYIFGIASALAGWLVVFFVPGLPVPVLAGLLVLIGFSSGAQVLTFVIGKESVPAALSGTVSGVLNTGIMTGPVLLQPAVGWMLDHHWQGAVRDGVRLYGGQAYQAGFGMALAWMALSLILLLFIRETYCRQSR